MRSIIFIMVFLFVGCISADKSQRDIKISKCDISFDLANSHSIKTNAFDITLTFNANNSFILQKYICKYFADTNEAGVNYFFDHYYVCLMTVKNNTDSQKEFNLSNFEILSNNDPIHLVDIHSLPKEVTQFNPNNLTKDVYNGILTTALILVTIKSGGVNVDIDKYAGSVHNTKNFSYENVFDSNNRIDGMGCIDGIIFVKKSDVKTFQNIRLAYK